MVTAEDVKKVKESEEGYFGYDELVKMACDRILADTAIGDGWSGDGHYLVKKGDEYAHVVMGYGSCSHCDTLEAIGDSDEGLADFANEIAQGIMWKTKSEMLDYLKNHDAEGSWYGSDTEAWQDFVVESVKAMEVD
jgi:hypothetical protein